MEMKITEYIQMKIIQVIHYILERIKINITTFDKCYKASQHPLLGVFGFHTDYKYCQVVI